MDTNVVDNNIKKNFKIFHFLAKFLSANANASTDEKNFCCKIFSLIEKLYCTNMRYVGLCFKKLVFSNRVVSLLPKVNF